LRIDQALVDQARPGFARRFAGESGEVHARQVALIARRDAVFGQERLDAIVKCLARLGLTRGLGLLCGQRLVPVTAGRAGGAERDGCEQDR
jgi:hypothetical protein